MLVVVVPVVLTALVFGGGLLTGRRLAEGDSASDPATTVTATSSPDTTARTSPRPRRPVTPSSPTRLVIPSLGIGAGVVDIDLSPDAVLEPPADADLVGWWTGSAQPGAQVGRVVITGHTVSNGDGALDRLPELKHGKVVLVTATGRHLYRVTDSLVVDYAEVAEHAEDIFGQSEKSPDGARLILVTCTDFNGSYYSSNAIIVAEPVRTRS